MYLQAGKCDEQGGGMTISAKLALFPTFPNSIIVSFVGFDRPPFLPPFPMSLGESLTLHGLWLGQHPTPCFFRCSNLPVHNHVYGCRHCQCCFTSVFVGRSLIWCCIRLLCAFLSGLCMHIRAGFFSAPQRRPRRGAFCVHSVPQQP